MPNSVDPLELLAAFVDPEAVELKELEGTTDEGMDSGRAAMARRCEQHFTYAIDTLRRSEIPMLGSLGVYAWEVFHHGHVKMAMGPNVPSLHIGIANVEGFMRCIVFCPDDWDKIVAKEPLMQFGAVIYIASQAVDYYNRRHEVDGSQGMWDRAASYEAEFIKLMDPPAMNDHQRGVLARYPNGYEARFDYERKPVVGMD